jgi:hypothetical protein
VLMKEDFLMIQALVKRGVDQHDIADVRAAPRDFGVLPRIAFRSRIRCVNASTGLLARSSDVVFLSGQRAPEQTHHETTHRPSGAGDGQAVRGAHFRRWPHLRSYFQTRSNLFLMRQ